MGRKTFSNNNAKPIMFPASPDAESSKPHKDDDGLETQQGSIPDSVLSTTLFP